jgi:hypothetical protein
VPAGVWCERCERSERCFVHLSSCLRLDRAGARTRARHRLQRAGTPPRSPRKASRKPGRAAWSFQGQKDSTGVLFLDISMLTSRERGELTGIMPSGRLHHTYSTPHTGQDTPIHLVERGGHSMGAAGACWGVCRSAVSGTSCPAARKVILWSVVPAAPLAHSASGSSWLEKGGAHLERAVFVVVRDVLSSWESAASHV